MIDDIFLLMENMFGHDTINGADVATERSSRAADFSVMRCGEFAAALTSGTMCLISIKMESPIKPSGSIVMATNKKTLINHGRQFLW